MYECDVCDGPIAEGFDIPFGTDGRSHIYCHILQFFDQESGRMTCYCGEDGLDIHLQDYPH